MSNRQLGKLIALAALILMASWTAAADEQPLGGDVFRSEKLGRDIFSGTQRSVRRPTQAEQSPPVRPEREAPLLGEGSLPPEFKKSLGETNAAGILEHSRTIRQAVQESVKQGGEGSHYLEQAVSAVRASSDTAALDSRSPVQADQAKPVRVPRKPPLTAMPPSGFSRASLSPRYPAVIPQSTLSVIVDGSDIKHARETLRRLGLLAKNKNVKVGNVYLVGVKELGNLIQETALSTRARGRARATNNSQAHALAAAQAIRGSFYKHIEEAGMGHYEVVPVERVLERWKVKYSPTWIVRHKGRDYVFEGFDNPDTFFNREGQFTREDG